MASGCFDRLVLVGPFRPAADVKAGFGVGQVRVGHGPVRRM